MRYDHCMPDTSNLTRNISGFTVTIGRLGAWEANRIATRLAGHLARAAGGLAGITAAQAPNLLGSDVAALAPALERLFAGLDEAEVEHLIRRLLKATRIETTGDNGAARRPLLLEVADAMLDEHPEVLILAAVASAEVNLGGFFAGLRGAWNRLAETKPQTPT